MPPVKPAVIESTAPVPSALEQPPRLRSHLFSTEPALALDLVVRGVHLHTDPRWSGWSVLWEHLSVPGGNGAQKPGCDFGVIPRWRAAHDVDHYRGNAYGSTLRLTLGCLLGERLGIALRRVGSGTRLTFADGEQALIAWMAEHAFVCWMPTPAPWEIESKLIATLDLPLNLNENKSNSFHPLLTARRAACKERARALPVAGS